jgi:hypothetical protein
MPPDDAAPPCATLRMPDGREISLPMLTDAAGALFVDVRKLQPDTGALFASLRAALNASPASWALRRAPRAQASAPSTRASAPPPPAPLRCG